MHRCAGYGFEIPVFIAVSTFTVVDGSAPAVHEAFRRRPHLVDDAPGFVRMEVFAAANDPAELWLITYWQDEESFRRWHRSHAYHASHHAIPKGLKLVPRTAALRFFHHIAS